MKVGIITMVSDNYGNRLQNYALQQALVGLGNEVETLNNPWEETGCINLNIKHEDEETLTILAVICYDAVTAFLYGHGETANDAVKDLEATYKELKQRFDK